ncbi:MAG: hypothetical protein COB75_06600 [Idiomarina sp.]|nr:MAG: hypothetical protein COB75_06600 [Idiomarina sp.]
MHHGLIVIPSGAAYLTKLVLATARSSLRAGLTFRATHQIRFLRRSQAGIMPENSWKMAGDIANIYLGMACWLSAAQYFKKSKFAACGSLIILGTLLTWSGWSAIL